MTARPPALPAALVLCLALAGCATPQQRCLDSVTRDLRVVEGLIAQSEVNLARGYGIREAVVFVPGWDYCGAPVLVQAAEGWAAVGVPGGLCLEDRPQTIRQPVAIDLDAEKRKLAQLKDQRVRLAREAEPAIAQCRQLYPQ